MAFPLIVDRDHAGWKPRNATPGRRPSGAPHAASVPTVRSARRLALVSVVEPGMRSLRTCVSKMCPFPKRAWQRSIQRRPAHRRRQLDRAGSEQGLLNLAEAVGREITGCSSTLRPVSMRSCAWVALKLLLRHGIRLGACSTGRACRLVNSTGAVDASQSWKSCLTSWKWR